jgi:hypothetical protein
MISKQESNENAHSKSGFLPGLLGVTPALYASKVSRGFLTSQENC